MGIVDIPDSYEAFESWALAYERAQFRFAETNRKIGAATRDLFASWFPRLLAPFVRCGIYAMLDDAMIDSFGVPRPVPGRRALLRSGLELRGLVVRWLPLRRIGRFFTDHRNSTHPRGYRIPDLGPPRLVAAEARRHAQGYTTYRDVT